MSSSDLRTPVVVILGPTAVGKTEVALQLASRLNGEIVSADSRLLYRGMDIGTAKPGPDELARVPHHLVNVTNPNQVWSLVLYQEAARAAIASIQARGRLPFLVGGTGQYIRAIIEGWKAPRVSPDPRLRAILENWAAEIGSGGLHARLAALDPEAAGKIDYRNLRRTVRALEVIFITGKPFSAQRKHGPSLYQAFLLGLTRPRQELYERIDARIEAMFAAGFVEEVRALLKQGYDPELPTLSAIGYREVVDYLQGKITLQEAIKIMKRRTRQFVRRQANWFKPGDPRIHWFMMKEGVIVEMETAIREWYAHVS
jgi:tRNA dimethylallyltransferase